MSGKNIVLLHGWGATASKLEPLSLSLKKLGWSVVVLKLPGFELSPPKEVWGVGEYADYVNKEAAKHFKNKKYFVFGHSFGGRVAIKMGQDNTFIQGVILCAAGGISRGNFLKRVVFTAIAKIGKTFLVSRRVSTLWRKLLYKVLREHDYEKTDGIMKEVFKKVVSEDLKPFIGTLSVPLFILWGESDAVTPLSDAKYITKHAPDSKLKTFKHQGHRLPYEKYEEIANEINTWRNTL